jgi:integrase
MVARESRKRGGFSRLVQARALFKPRAMRCYSDLVLPDVAEFLKADNFQPSAPELVEIGPEEMGKIAEAALKLRDTDKALYVAHLLFRHCGMRNDEIVNMRWDWIETSPDGVVHVNICVRPYWKPKGSMGRVPVSPCVLAELQAMRGDAEAADPVIARAYETHRADVVDRDHSAWLKGVWQEIGAPVRRKTSYELRRWAAGVVRDRQGRDAAEQFLRHAAPAGAGRFYMSGMFPWAKIEPITLQDAGVGR